MKPILALTTLLFCTVAFAQNDKNFHLELVPKYPLYRNNPLQQKFLFLNKFPTSSFPIIHLPYPGVTIFLSQDHMPCFVPQAATVATIPNFWSSNHQPTLGLVPNPAKSISMQELMNNQLPRYQVR